MNTRPQPQQLTLVVVFSQCGECFLEVYGRNTLWKANSIEARSVSQADPSVQTGNTPKTTTKIHTLNSPTKRPSQLIGTYGSIETVQNIADKFPHSTYVVIQPEPDWT